MKEWLRKLRRRVFPVRPGKDEEYTEIAPEAEETDNDEQPAGSPGKPFLTRIAGNSRREQELQELRAGYRELVDLIRSIREHLEGQAENRQAVVGGLQQVQQSVQEMDRGHQAGMAALDRMIERSERRWTLITSLVVIALLLSAGSTVYLVVKLEQRPPPVEAVPQPAPAVEGRDATVETEPAFAEPRPAPVETADEAPPPEDTEKDAGEDGDYENTRPDPDQEELPFNDEL